VPHTDTTRPAVGTIVPNPGGPGQSTIASAGLYTTALGPLRRDQDLLLIDPRGTGQSGVLQCPGLTAHDPLSLDLRTVGTICGAELGPRAGLYGSAAVADDIDAVRAALGLDKLDLWGDSYGTFLMTVYAARHPQHVRSVVLDGAFQIAEDRWGRDVLGGVGLKVVARGLPATNELILRSFRHLERIDQDDGLRSTLHKKPPLPAILILSPQSLDVHSSGSRRVIDADSWPGHNRAGRMPRSSGKHAPRHGSGLAADRVVTPQRPRPPKFDDTTARAPRIAFGLGGYEQRPPAPWTRD
jgi:pimeloyl-ACP methyl ester carboxylesterase